MTTTAAPSTTWTIGNVSLFDGVDVLGRVVLTVEGDTIRSLAPERAGITAYDVDGAGGWLLPGLVDAHVHVTSPADLELFAAHGITTVLDMATHDAARLRQRRDAVGGTDLRTAGPCASAPGGVHTRMMGFHVDSAVSGPEDAARFVARRRDDGSDYVKIIVEPPQAPAALDAETVSALVTAAHAAGLATIAHASGYAATALAVRAGVDVVTHTPLDRALDDEIISAMSAAGTVSVPTLTMMCAVSHLPETSPAHRPGMSYASASDSVTRLHSSGVRVLAGTDANTAPGSIANVAPGESLHAELGRLVEAGLTPTEALTCATAAPSGAFGLHDRGRIAPGRRADLVLVDGDPTADVAATRAIHGVWMRGRRTT